MLLFLDVISPIPEFFIIADNKVILNRKIIKKESEKLSEYILKVYISIDKDLDLNKNLRKISMTTGPGSFTSLRVGAAFLSGIAISKKLSFCPITINHVFEFKLSNKENLNTAVYLSSANDQNFICNMSNHNKIEYIKIEKNFIFPKNIKTILYNYSLLELYDLNIIQQKFSFVDIILKNYPKLKFIKNEIIKPIYISNNKVLN